MKASPPDRLEVKAQYELHGARIGCAGHLTEGVLEPTGRAVVRLVGAACHRRAERTADNEGRQVVWSVEHLSTELHCDLFVNRNVLLQRSVPVVEQRSL